MEFRKKIDKVLEIKQLKLWKLAEESGLNSTLEKAYKENRELSDKKTAQFREKMGINSAWWETGIGPILIEKGTRVNETPRKDGLIPFYDAVAVGGYALLADQSPKDRPVEYINPGTWLSRATGSLRVYGDSMFPKYPGGCMVAFKEMTSNVIVWGEDYVIELADRTMIKRIEKSEKAEHVKAVSYNINKDNKYVYDPTDIHMKDIKRWYIVLGRVILESSQ